MTPEQEIKLLKELLYCTKRSCNNCGKVNCENFQRQRIDCCGLWVSYKDYIKDLENKIADIKANCDFAIKGRDVKMKELETENNKLLDVINNQDIKIADLEQQIEKMKRHCNCKHRDGEGYCEVKRTYLMDLSYDGCDKWELED